MLQIKVMNAPTDRGVHSVIKQRGGGWSVQAAQWSSSEEPVCCIRRGVVHTSKIRSLGTETLHSFSASGGVAFDPCAPGCMIALRAEAEMPCMVGTGRLMGKGGGGPVGYLLFKCGDSHWGLMANYRHVTGEHSPL